MSYRVTKPFGEDAPKVEPTPPVADARDESFRKAVPWLLGIGLAATVLVLSSELQPFAARQ